VVGIPPGYEGWVYSNGFTSVPIELIYLNILSIFLAHVHPILLYQFNAIFLFVLLIVLQAQTTLQSDMYPCN
jgi:hypothetical protein